MTSELGLQLYSEMLKVGLLVCAPLLGLTLIVSLAISVVQVVTQVQDTTLAFVPKLVAFVLGALVVTPWMLQQLIAFAKAMFARAAELH